MKINEVVNKPRIDEAHTLETVQRFLTAYFTPASGAIDPRNQRLLNDNDFINRIMTSSNSRPSTPLGTIVATVLDEAPAPTSTTSTNRATANQDKPDKSKSDNKGFSWSDSKSNALNVPKSIQRGFDFADRYITNFQYNGKPVD